MPVRRVLRRTGIPYLASFAASYRNTYSARRFAGNLIGLREAYWRSSDENERRQLAEGFEAVLDALVLSNGVRKTTYARRQHGAVARFLSGPGRPPDGTPLRVLDLPSSSGVASLDSYELLRRSYPIRAYVLADVCPEVYYDPKRNAVYDGAGNLLQVQGRSRFFGIYRAHVSGDAYSLLTKLALAPLALRSEYLRRKHPLPAGRDLVRIRLLHPEVEAKLEQGVFSQRRLDVFALDLHEEFDLVLSFNLLQRNYFSPARIEEGLANLTRALKEGGHLLTGNTESFGIARKQRGRLEPLYREGEW